MSDSSEYWRKREEEQKNKTIKNEKEYSKEIEKIYKRMRDNVNQQIYSYYARYAGDTGVTMAEAKRRVSKLDIEEYERKAEKYVKEKDFSDRANEEMKLYNLTMKVNRLEMLKANIGLELVAGHDEAEKYLESVLTDETYAELERQAGILGKTVPDSIKTASSIVNASFHNATFSDRIWTHQELLKSRLDSSLSSGLIRGLGVRKMTSDFKKQFDAKTSDVLRLMRTELARVQIDAKMKSYEENEIDEYEYIALGNDGKTCEICRQMDGRYFKVSRMVPGTNAPPMHPNCRCSTGPHMDTEEFDEWLGTIDDHGLTFEEWKAFKANNIDYLGETKNFQLNSSFGSKKVKLYKHDDEHNIYSQTFSNNAKNAVKFIQDNIADFENKYGKMNDVIILKSNAIKGIGGYSYAENRLYIDEKIVSEEYTNQLLSGDFFAAKTPYELLVHEYAHKRNWDKATEYYGQNKDKYGNILEAKQSLESDLRAYVVNQIYQDYNYVNDVVSKNASNKFETNPGALALNELIADTIVRIERNDLNDFSLGELVGGVVTNVRN